MTYKIEITAETVAELAGRILAMAAQYQTTPTVIVTHRGKDEAAADPVMPEVKRAAEKEPAASSAADLSPTSNDAPVTPTVETVASPTDAPTVNYKDEIVPLALKVVKVRGRDAMGAVLDQFGVTRASEVPEALWGELRDALTEVLA